MICSKSLRMAHEEVQKKIFVMLPEKWDRLYLYASVIEHFNKLETGEMFFYYYPKGLLRKKPVNVYEVPSKFNIDENQYFKMSDELYASIKKLREECIKNKEKPWTNITISIENLKYKAEYGYEDLTASEFDGNARRIIWSYEYLQMPYDSFNRKEKKIIDDYIKADKEEKTIFELPIYKKEMAKNLEHELQADKNLTFVTEKKIEEMEYIRNHVPRSQILK